MEHFLHTFFEPDSVALFGASERPSSIGEIVVRNLSNDAFKGEVFLINPKHSEIYGKPCFKNLYDVGRTVELAIIATPASYVNQIIEDCGKCGVKAAIILSAGFGEIGAEGVSIERKVKLTAKRYNIRFIGPNCLGLMRPPSGFNATFNKGLARKGDLALISQSGALCTAILDWAENRKIGFSAVVSIGGTADVYFGELLDYLIYDRDTKSILLYVEGIKHSRSFISALKAASRIKPVLVMKVGRHDTGSTAAKTHTGAISGQDDVFNAVLRQAGAVRGYKVNDLFVAATVLAKSKRLEGNNLVILTNGGGPGAIAADRASDLSLALPPLTSETQRALSKILPANWSNTNPIDIIGDAPPERYAKSLQACIQDKTIHGIVIILTPQSMTNAYDVAQLIIEAVSDSNKVLIACFMGGEQVRSAKELLQENNIPVFQTPEAAIEAFNYLSTFKLNQKLLMQVPEPLQKQAHHHSQGPEIIIKSALSEGRHMLTELESMAILNAYGIKTPHASIAKDSNEAVMHAESIGYPVAMKIYSKDISHKSDVDGVRLGVSDASSVKSAFRDMLDNVQQKCPEADITGISIEQMYTKSTGRELMVGIFTDAAFGPIISFGMGGTSVELMSDSEVAVPPLNKTLVKELISRTKVSRLLEAFRQLPACDMAAIEQVLLAVSQMVCELPWIKELDINPLMADDEGTLALDARIVIDHHTQTRPYEHMAIHPYPTELIRKEVLYTGETLTIRPIRPEDAQIEKDFVDGLSSQSKYFRFMQRIRSLTQHMLVRFTQIDYDLEMALIAVIDNEGQEQEIGVARYVTNIDRTSCEFAIVVADEWQKNGIASRLMEALIASAVEKGLRKMEGTVLSENKAMLAFCQRLNFDVEMDPQDKSICNVVKVLN
ncbi:MAG: bifunctional acetate--CoA ligase family protein/GNAT family N-acetyltransferase [Pseudomonadota bacterium]